MVAFKGRRMNLTALCIAAAIAAASVFVPMSSVASESTDARANQLPLRFKDANGKVMGRAAWGNDYGYPYIIMQEGKQIFAIGVWPKGSDATLMEFRGDNVYYQTTDCSGPAYLNRDYEYSLQGLRLAAVLLSGDGRLSILSAPGMPTPIESQSARQLDSSCFTSSYPIAGVLVTETTDITGKYQPPFSIH
jgi:hypothetical protein